MSLSLVAAIAAITGNITVGPSEIWNLSQFASAPALLLSEIPFPNIGKVALTIPQFLGLGPFEIKWYGLSYLAGLILGWLYIKRLVGIDRLWPNDRAPFAPEKTDDILIYMTLGTIIGGRLGYVVFYEPSTYLNNPIEIFHIWKGGMAFHGALLGCTLAMWLFSKRNNAGFLTTMDLVSSAVPIGLFFGRLANFVNGELWGRPTTVWWAMVFPDAALTREFAAVEPTPRHPSQLYEAALEGMLLFAVLYILINRFGALKRPGLIAGVFVAGYGVARSFCELFRQYDPGHALSAYGLTPGIVYSIPMILFGAWLVNRAQKAASASPA